MAESALKIVLLIGSTREGRQGLRVAKFVKKQLEDASHSVDIIDPVEIQFPLLEQPLHFYPDQSLVPKWLQDIGKKIQEADAIVVVSPEYNYCIPPALSNVLDHFPPSFYQYKPSGIVSYSIGRFGGIVAANQLRVLLGILGCISVTEIFSLPLVHEVLDSDGTPTADWLVPGAQKFIRDLEWHAWAMKTRRETRGLPQSS